jgi:hypothetical protein
MSFFGAVLVIASFQATSSARSFVTDPKTGATIATCEGENLVFTGGGLDWTPPSNRPPNGPNGEIRCPYGGRHAIAEVEIERPWALWIGIFLSLGSIIWQILLVREPKVEEAAAATLGVSDIHLASDERAEG